RNPARRPISPFFPYTTLFRSLAVLVGVGTTVLGLAFALIATRTNMRFKGALRILSILPIITPPFVIGLALILLFGRSGTITALRSEEHTSELQSRSDTECRLL